MDMIVMTAIACAAIGSVVLVSRLPRQERQPIRIRVDNRNAR